MSNTRKVLLFSVLAAVLAAGEAPLAADPTTNHLVLVMPLVVMGIALLLAGYYAGLARK